MVDVHHVRSANLAVGSVAGRGDGDHFGHIQRHAVFIIAAGWLRTARIGKGTERGEGSGNGKDSDRTFHDRLLFLNV
ncbi:hypothetical protein D3C81_2224650 [compost metagenome]